MFTTRQAAAAGLDRRARHHHLTYGNWRRTEAPGVFKLVGWPSDDLERCRAWLLWAGPGAALTSWTALELLGCTVAGPRTPVGLAMPSPVTRNDVRRRRAARRVLQQLAEGAPTAPTVHPSGVRYGAPAALLPLVPGHPASCVDGLAVRPATEAMCAAVVELGSRCSRSVVLGVMDQLVDAGHLDRWVLARTAVLMGITPVRDHLWSQMCPTPDVATG